MAFCRNVDDSCKQRRRLQVSGQKGCICVYAPCRIKREVGQKYESVIKRQMGKLCSTAAIHNSIGKFLRPALFRLYVKMDIEMRNLTVSHIASILSYAFSNHNSCLFKLINVQKYTIGLVLYVEIR